jgi:holo-[acyl-carrier protein] synthase
MILGHGIDVQDVNRIRELLSSAEEDFLLSTYTRSEREIEHLEHERAEFFAGRFAAKEAVAKALGTGFVGDMSWQDVAILRKASGQPEIILTGATQETASHLGVTRWLISITHTEVVAFASAIAIQD